MESRNDLSDLSAEEALDLAIAAEEEARQRYLEFEDQMTLHHTEEAAEFFSRMADLERQHGARLRDHRRARFGAGPPISQPVPDPTEVEAPEYSEVRAFMTVQRAVDIAIGAERKAFRFYDDLIGRVDDDQLESLLGELRDQERRHERLLLDFRKTMPEEDPADPEDYVDPPRAL